MGGATETKIKFGHKKEQIPVALQNWIENKLYCTPGISIKTLAKHIGINSNYLSFYFNHVLGANFHQWLYTLRIEEAKRIILHNPGVKISEVASAVGIPVIYNFSRWFKSITGMTAVTWCNMCRAENAEKSEKNREIVEDSDMMH